MGVRAQDHRQSKAGKADRLLKQLGTSDLNIIHRTGTRRASRKNQSFSPMLTSSVCRILPAAVVAFSLVSTAVAQLSSHPQLSNQDSFEAMRTNQGEAMRAPRMFDLWPTYGHGDSPYWVRLPESVRFPPLPPGLGDPFTESTFAGAISFAGAEVAREIFYGPYTTLALRKQASAKLKARVEAYRASRRTLVQELTTKWGELRPKDQAARSAAWTEIARQQEGRLQALEAEAEAIRSEIAGVDANYRFFRFHPAGRIGAEISGVQANWLMKALYHYPGLSYEQRQLLPEVAYATMVYGENDVQQGREGEPTAPREPRAGMELYLFPATARIRLPARVPPSLQAKVDEFVRGKEALKVELRTAVLREQEMWGFRRAERLATLASQHAPRFAALEKQAEEIRIEIAQRGLSEVVEPSDLPADLTERVGEFTTRKAAVQRELAARLRQFRSEHGPGRFAVERQPDRLVIVDQQPDRGTVPGLAEFNASLVSRYAALARETEELKRDIQDYSRANPKVAAKSVDQVATQFAKAYASRENRERYRMYQWAVLEPGLSPAQRRLLFQAAVEALDQEGWLPRP